MTFGCLGSLPGQNVSVFVNLRDGDRQPRGLPAPTGNSTVSPSSRTKFPFSNVAIIFSLIDATFPCDE
jgi:hypothetical protein